MSCHSSKHNRVLSRQFHSIFSVSEECKAQVSHVASQAAFNVSCPSWTSVSSASVERLVLRHLKQNQTSTTLWKRNLVEGTNAPKQVHMGETIAAKCSKFTMLCICTAPLEYAREPVIRPKVSGQAVNTISNTWLFLRIVSIER